LPDNSEMTGKSEKKVFHARMKRYSRELSFSRQHADTADALFKNISSQKSIRDLFRLFVVVRLLYIIT